MRYVVRALAAGQLISLDLDAPHEEDAVRQARNKGYEVISAEARPDRFRLRRTVRFPLLLLSQELHALMKAGLGLIESLEGIAEKEHRPEIRAVLKKILDSLYAGQTFSAALANHPKQFPLLYSAMVRASERTGDLPQALMRYIGYEQQVEALRKKLVAASIYPLLLITVGGLVILFLLGYVVPRFSQIYADAGTSQSLMLRIVLAWAGIMDQHGSLILLFAFVFAVAAGSAFSMTSVRARIITAMWRL
ncbi:MAG: type II secretion system F family protein, partial [Nitrosospira sp.]|nr:type II secretion system F family protein [Nitrosospira sp.]